MALIYPLFLFKKLEGKENCRCSKDHFINPKELMRLRGNNYDIVTTEIETRCSECDALLSTEKKVERVPPCATNYNQAD